MVAISNKDDVAFRGVDYTVSLRYTPPEGETLTGVEMMAALFTQGRPAIYADATTFDTATGGFNARWQETTVDALVGSQYKMRLILKRGDDTRVIFERKVNVV